MPELFGQFQGLVGSLLWFGALGLAVFGLIDALRVPTDAFPYAGKRTKNLWLALLGVASAVLLVAGPMKRDSGRVSSETTRRVLTRSRWRSRIFRVSAYFG